MGQCLYGATQYFNGGQASGGSGGAGATPPTLVQQASTLQQYFPGVHCNSLFTKLGVQMATVVGALKAATISNGAAAISQPYLSTLAANPLAQGSQYINITNLMFTYPVIGNLYGWNPFNLPISFYGAYTFANAIAQLGTPSHPGTNIWIFPSFGTFTQLNQEALLLEEGLHLVGITDPRLNQAVSLLGGRT